MEPTDFRPPELRHATSVISTTRSGGYYRVNQPFSVGTSSSLSVAGPQGLMGYDVPHIPGNDPLHIPIGVVSKPPWQQVSSGSPPIPIAPLHTVPADPSLQPPHPPPTTPGPAKDQSHSPSVTPEKAEIQVRTSRGSHDKLTREPAGGPSGESEAFYRYLYGNSRITARRSAHCRSQTKRISCRRYTATDSPIASPIACANTVILSEWVYYLVITSSVFSMFLPCRYPSIDCNRSITWPIQPSPDQFFTLSPSITGCIRK